MKLHILSLCLVLSSGATAQTQLGDDLLGESKGDNFGISTALSGDGRILAVGAIYDDGVGSNSGHVRGYKLNVDSNEWERMGFDIDGEASEDQSGRSVSLSEDGKILAIGAGRNDGNGSNSGHVRVFQYESGKNIWKQIGSDIDGEAKEDYSGVSVSLSGQGDIIAIGAHENDGNGSGSGHTRVYEYSNSQKDWVQVGQDIDGESSNDFSGISVSMSRNGTRLAIGAYQNDDGGASSGHTRIFEYNQTNKTWTQIGTDIDGEAATDWSGLAVALDAKGMRVVIGAYQNDGSFSSAGHTRIFQYDENNKDWFQIGEDIDGSAAGDRSGWSVAISDNGKLVVIGAIFNDRNGSSSGQVRAFQYNPITKKWQQVGKDVYGQKAGDQCGNSVSVSGSGSIFAVGAYGNDEKGADAGQVRVFDLGLCQSTYGTLKTEAYCSYETPSGKSIVYSGQFLDTIQNAAGCDSIIEIDLNIIPHKIVMHPVDVSTSIGKNISFGVQADRGTYQWFSNLGLGYQKLDNAGQYSGVKTNTLNVSSVSLANNNQLFRCVNLYNDCADTSNVAALHVTGTSGLSQPSGISLMATPNPSSKRFNVEFLQQENDVNCDLFDITGRLISSFSFSHTKRISIEIDGEAGLYYLTINDSKLYSPIKLIKE